MSVATGHRYPRQMDHHSSALGIKVSRADLVRCSSRIVSTWLSYYSRMRRRNLTLGEEKNSIFIELRINSVRLRALQRIEEWRQTCHYTDI